MGNEETCGAPPEAAGAEGGGAAWEFPAPGGAGDWVGGGDTGVGAAATGVPSGVTGTGAVMS